MLDWFCKQSKSLIAVILVSLTLSACSPLPSATPTPVPVSDEMSYILEVDTIGRDYILALDWISLTITDVLDNAQLFESTEWKARTTYYIALLRVCGRRLRELKPPSRYEEMHQDFVEASHHYDRVADLLVEYTKGRDLKKHEEAWGETQLGVEAMERALTSFEQLLR